MIYFLMCGITITLLIGKNPISILTNVQFKWPFLFIGSLVVQLILFFLAISPLQVEIPYVLTLTFLGMVIALYINRTIKGVSWIFTGTFINWIALITHNGKMPVIHQTTPVHHDSRHHWVETEIWWLGDWIPLLRYTLSPGDVIVGIGLILFIVANSSRRGLINERR